MLTPETLVHAPGLIAPTGEDEDEERGLAEALHDLNTAGLDDQTLAKLLFDDPNLTIL